VADVKQLHKESEAEDVTYESKSKDGDKTDRQAYRKCLEMLMPEEYEFLVRDETKNEYRRIELNTLNVPELIKFVKSKIKKTLIRPTLSQLKDYMKSTRTKSSRRD